MERIQSLINRLYQQSSARASVGDLLATTELLYKELAKHGTAQIAANVGSVAVWLPKGFGQAEPNNIGWPPALNNGFYTAPVEKELGAATTSTVNVREKPLEQEPLIRSVAEVSSVEEILPPAQPVVPVPTIEETPTVAMAIQPAELLPHAEAVKEEYPLVFQLEVEPSDEEIDAALAIEKKKREEAQITTDADVEATQDTMVHAPESFKPSAIAPVVDKPKVTKPFPGYPDIAEVMKKVFPVAPSPTPAKREVNELVTDPASVGVNEKLPARGKEMADVLASSSGKITDIRKAISINEKYQMISSLFRADEDMFERSVRTLNNFGSLPEARFWMQRELVVKMGWNDDDELVQTFYRLVSRRFS